MAFKISFQPDPPQMESLPVAKITSYPLEQRDYRPYAQNRICLTPKGLVLQMWAFEVSPQEDSALRGVFGLFPQESEVYLSVTALSTEKVQVELLRDGSFFPLPAEVREAFSVHPFGGEDLQGVYWGNTITITKELIQGVYGGFSFEAGNQFKGNFYKLSQQPPSPHYGCFYPADFAGNPYGPASMGDFLVVDY
ncbi:hypothetical protein U6B65_09680 [Oscillospiraceae bacterium MB08-C2-2]|nr:hypothetical protein U6B65_09680 [Oscillospiraceae bacterium MB08-C2-2]